MEKQTEHILVSCKGVIFALLLWMDVGFAASAATLPDVFNGLNQPRAGDVAGLGLADLCRPIRGHDGRLIKLVPKPLDHAHPARKLEIHRQVICQPPDLEPHPSAVLATTSCLTTKALQKTTTPTTKWPMTSEPTPSPSPLLQTTIATFPPKHTEPHLSAVPTMTSTTATTEAPQETITLTTKWLKTSKPTSSPSSLLQTTMAPFPPEASYKFESDVMDSSGRGHHGQSSGSIEFEAGMCGKAASFDGTSKVVVQSFTNFTWGTDFSVSVWFKRTCEWGNYQGIVNNGYVNTDNWEIRMGRENDGQMLGGGVFTNSEETTWAYANLIAQANKWNHVAMTYDGATLLFYMNGVLQEPANPNCCSGPILTRGTPVTIGQAGDATSHQFFCGLIDEVMIYTHLISESHVNNLFDSPCL